MRKLTSVLILLLATASSLAAPPAPIPRKSPEFNINEPSGKITPLSSFRGKVVMIEFFFLRSVKCLNLARTMNKLNTELAPRGFQAVGIAFPAPQSDANGPLVSYIVDDLKLKYPVGYTDKDKVDQYLNREPSEVLRIPQVVIIDRAGMIRAETGGRDGNLRLEQEDFLRALLDSLLKENSPPAEPAKQPPPHAAKGRS